MTYEQEIQSMIKKGMWVCPFESKECGQPELCKKCEEAVKNYGGEEIPKNIM